MTPPPPPPGQGRDLSHHQKKIVDRYYDNIDTIMLAKLGELVGEVYLASGDEKALGKLWPRVEKALVNLKLEKSRVRAIVDKRDVEALAGLVNRKSVAK